MYLNSFDEAKSAAQRTLQQAEQLAAAAGSVIPYDRREVLRWGMERYTLSVLDARDEVIDFVYEMMAYNPSGHPDGYVLAVLSPSIFTYGYEVQDGVAAALDALTLPDPSGYNDEISQPLELFMPQVLRADSETLEAFNRASHAGMVRFLRHVKMYEPTPPNPVDPERLARYGAVQTLKPFRPTLRPLRGQGGMFGG